MSSVDDFFEFVAMELGKDHASPIKVCSTVRGSKWYAEGAGLSAEGAGLAEVLNKLSQALDYTNKDLEVEEEPSLVKRVIELAREHDSSLTVTQVSAARGWRVQAVVKKSKKKAEGYDLWDCLREMLNHLLEGDE